MQNSLVHDVIVNLARIGGASKFSGKIEAFLEEYLVTESGLTTVPFGGRDEDVALLDAWLDDETAPPRYLLTAPAGRGKSALLVRWLQHLREQDHVGRDASAAWQLVFIPISIRFETHRPDIFYEALAARLADILGAELPPTHTDKGVYYADHCRTLARAAVDEGRRILIVLDGIDEALGERFDARWFPRNPGTRLRLVCSARWQAGDLGASGWQTRLGWERDVRVQSRELPVLARDGVRDLLLKMGAPTDVLALRPDIIDRLYDLTEGEPLVLRYYAEDIWSRGEAAPRLTIADLAQLRPGLGAYFEGWLDEQGRLWRGAEEPVDRRRVDVLLAILACAHGRLTGGDLRALLTERGESTASGRFIEQLKPIQRFVIGLDRPEAETAGYILSHPKLGIYLREEHFDPGYTKTTQAAFVSWGQKTVEQLNSGALRPEETPVYLLQYHTQHLQDEEAPAEVFLDLVELGWMHAWERFEGGYRGFSRDVRLTYETLSKAHTADQPRFTQRLRCQLVSSSIHSIGINTPWELLVAACKAGVRTYWQVAHWLEFKPSADRVYAIGQLASHLPAELIAAVLSDALTVARAIEDSAARAHALGALAPHLPAELLPDALTAARAIEDSAARADAFSALAPHLPAELLSDALTMAWSMDRAARVRALSALAPHLPAELLSDALVAARAMDSFTRADAFSALAPHLPAELLPDALTAARAIEFSFARADALSALAPHLPAELLPDALAAARAMDSFARARVLRALASRLPAELLPDALVAARAIEDSAARGYALSALAPHLPAELLPDALAAARVIEDRAARGYALSALAPRLPAELGPELLPDALTVARAIEDSAARAHALGALAPHLPAELLPDALVAARAIEDSAARAHALGALAPHLPAELLPDALTAVWSIKDSAARTRVLSALASRLPAELLAEVLTATRAIEFSFAHADALSALAPRLPAELLPDALAAARAIKDGAARADALGALAPRLPAELLPDALTAARAIEDSAARARALGALAPHLPAELSAELLLDTLTAARAITNGSSRARALSALAPRLPAELLPDALTAAQSIKDSFSRVRALGALAPHLPAELGAEVLADALTAARAIEDSAARARALGALAPHLPAELLPDALTAARAIEDSAARARALGALAPQLSGNILQQGFEELLDVLPMCRRDVSLFAVSSFFPFLEAVQGLKGLQDVRCAIADTAHWFP